MTDSAQTVVLACALFFLESPVGDLLEEAVAVPVGGPGPRALWDGVAALARETRVLRALRDELALAAGRRAWSAADAARGSLGDYAALSVEFGDSRARCAARSDATLAAVEATRVARGLPLRPLAARRYGAAGPLLLALRAAALMDDTDAWQYASLCARRLGVPQGVVEATMVAALAAARREARAAGTT